MENAPSRRVGHEWVPDRWPRLGGSIPWRSRACQGIRASAGRGPAPRCSARPPAPAPGEAARHRDARENDGGARELLRRGRLTQPHPRRRQRDHRDEVLVHRRPALPDGLHAPRPEQVGDRDPEDARVGRREPYPHGDRTPVDAHQVRDPHDDDHGKCGPQRPRRHLQRSAALRDAASEDGEGRPGERGAEDEQVAEAGASDFLRAAGDEDRHAGERGDDAQEHCEAEPLPPERGRDQKHPHGTRGEEQGGVPGQRQVDAVDEDGLEDHVAHHRESRDPPPLAPRREHPAPRGPEEAPDRQRRERKAEGVERQRLELPQNDLHDGEVDAPDDCRRQEPEVDRVVARSPPGRTATRRAGQSRTPQGMGRRRPGGNRGRDVVSIFGECSASRPP